MQLQLRRAGNFTGYVPVHALFVLAVIGAEQVPALKSPLVTVLHESGEYSQPWLGFGGSVGEWSP
jgi:hypothetical protein